MPARIAVLGLGYVGCVSAGCLAKLGYNVIGVDRDEYKVQAVNNGRAPFFEPELDEIVSSMVRAGRLRAAHSLADSIDDVDIALICVGTPSEKNGDLGLEQLRRVSMELAGMAADRTKPLIVAVRSTVLPGTCGEVVGQAFTGNANVQIVSNPEFLREGVAVRDFMQPSLLVVGSDRRSAAEAVASLYARLDIEPHVVSLRTAELIKYACNSFHAVKVAFANEIGALCQSLGIDATEVMETFCQDTKLNLSAAYLKPGFAFGGSCLPKDLRALNYRAGRLDLQLPLLAAALRSNEEHLKRAATSVLDIGACRLGVIGLAFKENTDDLRESPVVALLERLIGKGREVRVFDPHIQIESIYGNNRNFVLQQIPHIGRLMDSRIEDTLAWAEHLVIAQMPSEEHAAKIANSGLPITDVVNCGIQANVDLSLTAAPE